MRLLLDENLPKRLKEDFSSHQVYTVRDMGWNGIKNGELLSRMLVDNFNALLTFDKNLQHQQNFSKYTITVFVLSATINTYEELTKLSARINQYLESEMLEVGPIVVRSGDSSQK